MEKLLLPGDWLHLTAKIGVNVVSPADFDGRLYRSDGIDHAGVPSIFARAFSFTKALERTPQAPRAREYFARLIQGMFLGVIDVVRYDQNQRTRLAEVMKGFEAGSEQLFILKWHETVVGASYSECLVFPGAKFQAASDWADGDRAQRSPEPHYIEVRDGVTAPDVTLSALAARIEDEMQRYSPDYVKALFALWIDEIRVTLDLPVGRSLVLMDSLSRLANDEWARQVDAPLSALDRHTNVIGTLPVRNVDGKLVGIPLRMLQAPVFCERLVICSNGRVPQIPVPAENLSLVVASAVRETFEGRPVYEVQLYEWAAPISWTPRQSALVDRFEGSLLLWPNFQADAWGVNFAYFLTSTEFAATSPAARLLTADGQLCGAIAESEGCKTRTAVAQVELVIDGQKAGIFVDERPRLEAGRISKTISLDFGTANTSVGIYDEGSSEYITFAFEDISYDLLTALWREPQAELKRAASEFLPTASISGGANLTSLPSELLFRTAGGRARGDLSEPIANFTIPFPQFQRANVSKMLVSNFKWEAPEGLDRDDLISTYLQLLLTMVAAQIRREHLCRQIDVVPTYPLAFGPGTYDRFKALFSSDAGRDGLFAKLKQETGITLSLAIVNPGLGLQELIAESYAVEAFSVSHDRAGTALMVVDIGGGTTDVAVRTADSQLVDSISFAGNDFVAYMAEAFKNSLPEELSDSTLTANDRVILLQKVIREGGIGGLLSQLSIPHQRAAQAGMDRFYLGLFVYLERLLAKVGMQKVDFFPVGNGWRFIEGYTSPHNSIPEYVHDLFKRWDIDANVILPTDRDFKGAVSKGAIRIAREGNYQHPEEISVKTIVGGDIHVSGHDLSWMDSVPTGGLTENGLTFDTSGFIAQFADISGLSIPERDLGEMSLQLDGACQSGVYTAPGLMFGLNRSVLRIFLERIYPRLLRSLGGGGRRG